MYFTHYQKNFTATSDKALDKLEDLEVEKHVFTLELGEDFEEVREKIK